MVNFKFLARLGIGAALAIPLLPDLPVMNAAGIVFLVSGLVLAIIARKKLADNWSAAVVIKVDHELITTGIYHRIRHPIYSGIMLMATGTSLSIGTSGALLAFLVIGLAIWLKLSREEMLLTEHFGAEYEEYKKHTKKLIPYIW
jgi:protein-S-isoprenylcysteine O-methyltransferase Ste14